MVNADLGDVSVHVLPKDAEKSGKATQAISLIIGSRWFQKLTSTQLKGYHYLVYRPPSQSMGLNFIANDYRRAAPFENKADFRLSYADSLPFIDFEIDTLNDNTEDELYAKYHQLYGEFFVQDEDMSGGQGTFLVTDRESFSRAYRSLVERQKRIVVSRRFNGKDYSVQCCATKYGVFVGPLQRQLINDPELCNTELEGGEKFCGVQVGVEEPYDGSYQAVAALARTVGSELYAAGVKGIFSIDVLINAENNELRILEVNPRMTGVTPVFNLAQQRADIPLPLLHILETSGSQYEVSDFDESDLHVDVPPTSLLILRNKSTSPSNVNSSVASGAYSFAMDKLSDDVTLKDGVVTLHSYVPEDTLMGPGDKIASLYMHETVLTAEGELTDKARTIARASYQLYR